MTIFSKIARAKYLAWRSEKNKRSYQEKIERGECGHCSEPLAPNSKSCCVKHLEYFKHKTRNARGVQSNITALAARTSTFPKPATANADTHAAHESRMPVSGTTPSGSVPTERKLS